MPRNDVAGFIPASDGSIEATELVLVFTLPFVEEWSFPVKAANKLSTECEDVAGCTVEGACDGCSFAKSLSTSEGSL